MYCGLVISSLSLSRRCSVVLECEQRLIMRVCEDAEARDQSSYQNGKEVIPVADKKSIGRIDS